MLLETTNQSSFLILRRKEILLIRNIIFYYFLNIIVYCILILYKTYKIFMRGTLHFFSKLFQPSQHLIQRATMAYLEILCTVAALLLAFCYYSTSAFGFWKNRGIPEPKPVFFFGNSMDLLFSRHSTAVYLYKNSKACQCSGCT